MRYIYFILLGMYVFCSCSKDNKTIKHTFNSIKNVYCNKIIIDSILGTPYQIRLIDNYLILADEIDSKNVIVYDYKSKRIVNYLLSTGQGPLEVLSPLLINVFQKENLVTCLQRQNGVYTEYPLTNLLNSIVIPSKTMKFEKIDRIVKTNNGYLSEGFYETGSIGIHDSIGRLLQIVDVYPEYLKEVDTNFKYRLGQGVIGYNQIDNTFAYASYFTGEVRFYNLSENKLNLINNYNFDTSSAFENRITNNPNDVEIKELDIEHSSDIYSTDQFFYILYCGEPITNKNKIKYSYILKFTKDGTPVDCLMTDRKIFSICVNESNTKVFGISLSDELDYILVEMNI